MKPKLLISALFALGLGLPSVQAAEDPAPGAEKPAIESVSLVTMSATVTAVNQETREVTLKDAQGKETVLRVGEHVKNLAQVEAGDEVDIAYYESVDVRVLAADEAEPGAAAISALETAEAGRKPAAELTSDVSLVATIEAIDRTAQTVTLKGPEGATRTVRVRNPDNLEKVAVGDRVLISLTQAIAVEVTEKPAQE